MDPTALPTDNLYKFLALAGLMLAGFCAWLSWKMRETRLAEVEGHSVEAARSRARRDALQQSWDLVQAEVARMQAKVTADSSLAGAYMQPMKEGLAKVERMADQLETMSVELAATNTTLTAIVERWKRHAPVIRLFQAAVPVGLLISILGFSAWYLKVQWYVDKQTKADFEDHMAELAVKRAVRAKVKP